MKRLTYLLLVLPLLFAACNQEKPLELNVMTFNIRLDHAGDSLNNWKYRKDNAADMIRINNVDILGTQEVLLNQLNDMKERLPEYNVVGVGREDGAEKGEFCALFYKKEKFTEIESGNFWLSETPDVAGSRGWDAACVRVATWAKLKDNKTNKQVFAINTHLDHMGDTARIEGCNLLLKKIGELSNDLPVVLSGDFNATPDSEVIRTLTDPSGKEHLTDTRLVAQKVSGTEWTFHDFGRIPIEDRTLIDYIFVSKPVNVTDYQVLPDTLNGTFISDHKAVMAKLEIK